jgi:hypothetical protein
MFQALLIIFVYIIGPALVLTWAVRRYRSGVKPDMTEIVAIVLSVTLIGLLIWNYSGTVTDTDEDDAKAVVAELISSYPFPVQAKFENRPAVDGIPQAYNLQIRIYGVEDKREQDKIAALAKKLRKEVASKPIVLNFFREEVWEEAADGSRRPLREKEFLLRKVRIE